LGARPVVSDDVVDERVLEDAELLERVDKSTDVVVGVLEEARVDLHLPCEHGLQLVGHVLPGRYLLMPGRELGLRRDYAELLLPLEDPLPQHIPAVVEPTSVPLGPLGRDVVWRVRRAGREVDEERLVRRQRLLLAHPRARTIGQGPRSGGSPPPESSAARPPSCLRTAPGSTGSSPRRGSRRSTRTLLRPSARPQTAPARPP